MNAGSRQLSRSRWPQILMTGIPAALLLLAAPVHVLAENYYVRVGGAGAQTGADWDNAFDTIGAAMALVDGGDAIHVAAGTYNEQVTFPASNDNQLLGGYPAAGGVEQDPWNYPTIIDGGGTLGPMIYVPGNFGTNRGYEGLVIDGFTVRGGMRTSTRGAAGIESYSVGLTISRCIIEDNNNAYEYGYAAGIYAAGLSHELATRTLTIKECVIRNNSGKLCGGVFIDNVGPAFKVELVNDLIYGNHDTNSSGSTYGTGGVVLGNGPNAVPDLGWKVINCTIANNTSDHALPKAFSINIQIGRVVLRNNIFWNPGVDDVFSWDGAAHYQLTYSDSEDAGDAGGTVISMNPGFVGGGDYHLASDASPCVDTGTATDAPANDLDGTSRPSGSDWDMGAYELVGDSDEDGVLDDVDNCPAAHNPLQEDDDNDGVGNACDDCLMTPPGEVDHVNADGCSCLSEDSEDPVIFDCPGDIDVDADAACTAVVNWTEPTATDECEVTLTSTHAPGDTFSLGTTLVTYAAEDAAGNTAQCSFEVTVSDNEDPVITGCPSDISVSMDLDQCSAVVTWSEPTASDNCSLQSFVGTHSPGQAFGVGTTGVMYTALDGDGNGDSCQFTVTVTDDQDPEFTCPDDIDVGVDAGLCGADITVPAPSDVFDNCGVDSVVNDFTGTGDASGFYPVGTTTVTWTVTDIHGNATDCTHTVTVSDDEAPVVNSCPVDRDLAVGANCQVAVPDLTGEFDVDDNCDTNPTLTQAPVAGTMIPLGDTVVTMTAEDQDGNSISCQVTLTVVDDAAPAITDCPSDRTLQANAICEAAIPDLIGEVTAIDNCDPAPTITQDPAAGTTVGLGVNDVSMTVTDNAGNPTTCTVRVTVAGGTCDQDADGIDGTVEDGAPNNGDGNNDGILDSEQVNVSSLPNISGDYITIVSPDGTTLASVSAMDNPSPGDAPEGATFPAGFLEFDVTDVPTGGAVTVQIILNLPPGNEINSYWKYGPTPDAPTPHWYEFLFNGTTGAQISGNTITLQFVDGQRGDGDLAANGIVADPGAPAVFQEGPGPVTVPGDDCGAGLCGAGAGMMLSLTLVGFALLERRRWFRRHCARVCVPGK